MNTGHFVSTDLSLSRAQQQEFVCLMIGVQAQPFRWAFNLLYLAHVNAICNL